MSASPRRTSRRRTAAATLCAATAAAATMTAVLLSSASAQNAGTRTLVLHERQKGATLTHIRNTPTKAKRSALQGDLIVFTNPLTDAAGTPTGKLSAQCVVTTGARSFLAAALTCSSILHLRDGDLTVQINTMPGAAASIGAVTGGTRAYANARGVLVTKTSSAGSVDTLTLVD